MSERFQIRDDGVDLAGRQPILEARHVGAAPPDLLPHELLESPRCRPSVVLRASAPTQSGNTTCFVWTGGRANTAGGTVLPLSVPVRSGCGCPIPGPRRLPMTRRARLAPDTGFRGRAPSRRIAKPSGTVRDMCVLLLTVRRILPVERRTPVEPVSAKDHRPPTARVPQACALIVRFTRGGSFDCRRLSLRILLYAAANEVLPPVAIPGGWRRCPCRRIETTDRLS